MTRPDDPLPPRDAAHDENNILPLRKSAPPPQKRGSPPVKWLRAGAAASAVCLVLLLAAMLLGASGALDQSQAFIERIRPIAIALQCAAILALWWYWAQVVAWLRDKQKISKDGAVRMLTSRNRVCAMLVVLEVTLVIGFPFRYL
jgi:hypothetical protein